MRRSSTALAAPILALCATLLCGCGKEAVKASPNFVLISLDTLRSRSLHAYGYARETSPFFDSIARQGVLFERAITTSVTTGPSHMSLFTGLYPRAHGMISGMERKRASVRTLAERLREAGYATKAITENGFIIRQFGFGAGFDEYSEHVGERRNSSPGLIDDSFFEAERWLAKRHEKPFFLFVHTYQVHAPYTPPEEYRTLFAGDEVPGAGIRGEPKCPRRLRSGDPIRGRDAARTLRRDHGHAYRRRNDRDRHLRPRRGILRTRSDPARHAGVRRVAAHPSALLGA